MKSRFKIERNSETRDEEQNIVGWYRGRERLGLRAKLKAERERYKD